MVQLKKKDYRQTLNFKDFNLHESLQMGLGDIGYSEPTPIQEKSIPVVLEGKDVLGAAQTGTGKTGAFVIPIIQQILENPSEGTKALILSPTRELAQQIDEQIFALGYHTGLSSATIIGGEDFARQANAIRAGVDIIVATPGRLIDQTKVLDIDFSNVKYLVLDEADRMLDMGFLPDVSRIIDNLPKKRQTLLFSATMDKNVTKLSKDYMKDPAKIEIEISKPAESVEQKAYLIDGREKLKLIQQLMDDLTWSSCIIFTATKRGTDQLERLLAKKGIDAASIHGDRNQDERTKALNDFKNGKVPIIVATDVLSRGIDIADVSLIINYDVPKAVEDYIHRIGRTGRYDKEGLAITLVSKQDTRFFKSIQDKVGDDLEVIKGFKASNSKKTRKKSSDSQKPESKNQDRKSSKDSSRDKKDSDKQSKKDIKPDFSKAKSVIFDMSKDGKISVELKNKPKQEQNEKKDSGNDKDRSNKKTDQKQNSKSDNKSGRGKSKPKNNRKKEDNKKDRSPRKPKIELKTIEAAAKRSQKYRKPSKGFWGLIKSFFPKLGG